MTPIPDAGPRHTDDLALVALALAKLPGVGRRRLRRGIIRLRQGPAAACEDVSEALALALDAMSIRQPSTGARERAWDAARRVRDRCWQQGWHVWVIGGPGYPAALMRLDDPPALLFVDGPPTLPSMPRIAIVGTRDPSEWGRTMAGACARASTRGGAIVVSGLAVGIDTAAHEAVVDEGGQTWATLPSGLDVPYPPANHLLAARIVEAGGALVSEYWPGAPPQVQRFVERDRLQVGLSAVVLVVETRRTGGTQHTIRCARRFGVPVWTTLPDEITEQAHRSVEPPASAQLGCWDLWRGGAARVTSDMLEEWARTCQQQPEGSGPWLDRFEPTLF